MLAQGTPPWFQAPHHGEVTHPWAPVELLPNNNDTQSTTKYGFLLRPSPRIAAMHEHYA